MLYKDSWGNPPRMEDDDALGPSRGVAHGVIGSMFCYLVLIVVLAAFVYFG